MPWDDKDKEGQGGSIEYVFSITDAKAGFTEYNEGNTCLLILEGEKEFSNGKLMDDNLWVSTPEGWTCTDDGSFFVAPDQDPDRRFDKRTKIQQFIKSAVDAGVPLADRTDNSLDTRGWAGLKVRIREEERSFQPKDGDKVTYSQPLVIEYLGEVSGGAGPKAVAEPKESAPVKAATNGDSGSDAELIAKARAIAQESNDLIEHMDRVNRELNLPLDHQLCSASFFEASKAS